MTQATPARPADLGVDRRPAPKGACVRAAGAGHRTLDRERQLLDLKTFVNEVRMAQNLLVVATPPGHANGVARAIDLAGHPGFVGSVAGDDTILVVLRDAPTARLLKRKLEMLAGHTAGAAK